jgi:hypothetical protein
LLTLEAADVRTIGSILMIAAGLVWEFSAEIQTSIGQIIDPGFQAWLASHISRLGPLVLIAGGILWIVFSRLSPVLRRGIRSGALAIVYEPQAHTSVRRGNMRDYYVEVRNRTTDRTISDVIVTWDETPFMRFMDRKHSRDCLLPPPRLRPPRQSPSSCPAWRMTCRRQKIKMTCLDWQARSRFKQAAGRRMKQRHDLDMSLTDLQGSEWRGDELQHSAGVQAPFVLLEAKPVAGPGEMDLGWPREQPLNKLGSPLYREFVARPDARQIGCSECPAGTPRNTLRQQPADGGKDAQQAQWRPAWGARAPVRCSAIGLHAPIVAP